MSFGSGGFGFGQGNQAQQPTTGFGFGSNTNTTSAFGQNTGSGFGSTTNNTGGGLFGGGSTSGGFGSTGGGFGSTTSSAFGAKPAFGGATTSAGGLFGSSTTSTAGPSTFGGFGAGSNNTSNATSAGFGSGSSLFGGTKPATGFGSGTTGSTGTSLFGGGGGSAFGSTTGGAFGASSNPGIGTNIGEPPGTNVVTFQPTVEKEANNATQQNSFQNVLFMEPYKKFSAEELRLADYAQGRRYGNATGGGAFGVNSSFGSGGFGSNTGTAGFGAAANTGTGGGLFGSNNQTATTGFGQTSTTSGGFGSGGGLFGSNKPAGTGLFGSTTTSQPAQTGGLFGGSTGGFGSATNTGSAFGASNTGGGLFGSNNAASTTANKPAGFSFGTGTTGTAGAFGNTGTTGAFGNTTGTTSGGGLFGNTTQQQQQQQQQPAGGLFGGQAQANTTSAFGGGAFGQQNQQQGTSSLFGNQQKPAGSLFGSTNAATNNTGGGLFGSGTTNTTATPFGASSNQTSGGLFGNKPATTGGGLFGSTNTVQGGTTGGGLFGNLGSSTQTQQQQPAQGGLFGLGQNTQNKSMFGSTQGAGGGIFGAQTQQPQQGSLFGSTQQQPAQGNQMFGASQNQSAPQSLTTSLADMSAFGTSSLFPGVGGNDVQNPGPLATPLSSAKKQPARASILPIYKLSKPQTPKRGFGFSYSTYGTPTTPSSVNSTPGGFGQSLLAGSLGRSLNKSISTSNLRRSFNAEDSILAPGAFSASTGPKNYGSTGSIKRLVINRDIRSDLFSTPKKDGQTPDLGSARKGKRVSFDTSTAAAIEQGGQSPPEDTASPSGRAQDLGYLRPAGRGTNGVNGSSKPAASDGAPEMEQVKGNELAIVHEEESPNATPRSADLGRDQEAGDYWMRPSKAEVQDMNRVQRQKVTDFTVGRDNIGYVRFRVPVDLSNIDLDEIFEGLVVLRPRSCTVYPNPAKKPAMGKGLNVPAEISLEQSWPRGRDKAGSRGLVKHVERLKRIPDTSFVSYNPETGIWVFTVEHFTTYGLDDDEDDEGETELEPSNTQPLAVANRAPAHSQPKAIPSPVAEPDEDFRPSRGRRVVPGAFDPSVEAMGDEEDISDHRGYVRSPSPNDSSDSAPGDHAADTPQDMADLEMTVQEDVESPEIAATKDRLQHSLHLSSAIYAAEAPASILRARMRAIKESTAPASFEITGGDDWMDILKKSVNSGRQRDRAALHSLQESTVKNVAGQRQKEKTAPRRVVSDGRGFATSIDLMKSLFGKDNFSTAEEGPAFDMTAVDPPTKPFIKWPYQKQSQASADSTKMDLRERQFHNSFKPRWSPSNSVLVIRDNGSRKISGELEQASTGVATGSRELWSADIASRINSTEQQHRYRSWVATRPGPGKIPEIAQSEQLPSFKDILISSGSRAPPPLAYEERVWELASILFDPVEQKAEEKLARRQKLSIFWQKLVHDKASAAILEVPKADEKAFACLTGHQIVDACKYLVEAKLYKLATLVSLIGTSDRAREDMAEQVQDWQDGDVLAEMETPLRAIYGLLAGKVAVCDGKTGAGSENRLETLVFSEHFGLSWQQSFGLRLWYGISTKDDIGAAVAEFERDMDQGLIPLPSPWYSEDAARADKENSAGVQDLMWGLLKLYAGRASLEDVLQPESCSPSRTDYSLCWQLGQLLAASGNASFAVDSRAKMDSLTVSYGSQLMGRMSWLQAVEVLLHLSDRGSRAKAIQNVIARVAMAYADLPYRSADGSQGVRELLQLERYHVPKTWIAEACALAYRHLSSRVDCLHPSNFHLAVKEIHCLALAERPQELESTIVRKLDPLAILHWPPGQHLDGLARYLRARPVDDGLADVLTLASKAGGGRHPLNFDFDGYLAMLRQKFDEADEKDVVTLAALSTMKTWVENKRLTA